MGWFGFGKKKATYTCCGQNFRSQEELDAHILKVHGGIKPA